MSNNENTNSQKLYSVSDLSYQLKWEDLDEKFLKSQINVAKEEDLEGIGLDNHFLKNIEKFSGDITSNLLQSKNDEKAVLKSRSDMIVCGLKLVPIILDAYGFGCKFKPATNDGDRVIANTELGTILGSGNIILTAERIILNFLQHLSGIASLTSDFISTLDSINTRLLDTRKTTPGMRALEKYAVSCGGGWNHRYGLFDRIMLKDNHLANLNKTTANGCINDENLTNLIKKYRSTYPGIPIEVEVDNIEQIDSVITSGIDIILLDNFIQSELEIAVKKIDNRVVTEASGGITLENISSLKNIGLDFISTGALVHQSQWKDIGLDWL